VGAFTAFYDNGKLTTENELDANKKHLSLKGGIISAFKDPNSSVKVTPLEQSQMPNQLSTYTY